MRFSRARPRRSRHVLRTLTILLVGGPCAVVAGFLLPKPWPSQATRRDFVASAASDRTPEKPADWCVPELEPIDGDGCFAMPSSPRTGRPLLIYLHGRYARSAAAEEADRQRKVAVRGTARGFAVLTLRGRLGGCSAPELEDWFCWPSNEKNADTASEFIDSWVRALATAQKRADSRTRFVLGFSNGGYFAGLIASRGLLDLDAVAVAHGGLVELARDLRDKPPMLLLSADDDIAQDDMIRFDDALSHAGWPHDSYARAGGHALTDEDIEAALTFFSRAGEPLPLKPSLPLHRAVRHARDAGVGPDVQEPSSESSEPPDKSDEQDDDSPASAL